MTKVCPSCNANCSDTAKFCVACGGTFAQPAATPASSTMQPAGKQRFCPFCGKTISLTARFCSNCSKPLTMQCPTCSKTIKTTAKFCPHCSQSLSAMPIPPMSVVPGPKTGMLPPNTTVANRYTITRKLGQGGMGAVYLASDNRFQARLVAVKEMSTSGLQTADEKQQAIDAFRREAQLLCSLNHPNIPRVFDIFEENGKQFLAMDYVDGKTFDDLLDAQNDPFSESQVLEWAQQLCDVLTYLHGQNPPVIFRDLKPANVMIHKDMQTIKLIDFGIVRFFKPGSQTDTVKLGTPGYAPPEQYGKGGQSDARSDVYALGALLHQLLTLRDPGSDPFKFPPVRSLNSKVSAQVESAIAKAVQVKPESRWQTANEFLVALCGSAAASVSSAAPPKTQIAVTPPPPAKTPIQTPAKAPQANVQVKTPQASGQQQIVQSSARPLAISKPAPHGSRIGALVIDGIVLGGIALFFYVLAGGASSSYYYYDSVYEQPWFWLYLLSYMAYNVVGHATKGQTVGKKMTHVRVVCMDGSQPGFFLCLWRYLSQGLGTSIIAFIPGIGVFLALFVYILPLLNQDHRALHDYMAGTKVIET